MRFAVLSLFAIAGCLASPATGNNPPLPPPPRPLVLWHGLGDSHSSPGMLDFQGLIKEMHKDIFIHSIYIEEDLGSDQKAGFFGNIFEQLELVAQQLKSIPELAHGFDGLGLSQGGQFLRAYIEMYNNPPVHNLITFGSQHFGISDLPLCKPMDFLCKAARSAARAGVYSSWAQNNLIQAQYFRDPTRYSTYLQTNHFLTSINNELPDARNRTYADNFASLNNLVLVLFDKDVTVVPKESGWFGSYVPLQPPDDQDFYDLRDAESDFIEIMWHEPREPGRARVENPNTKADDEINPIKKYAEEMVLVEMKDHPIYKEDWIGLKRLDEREAIHFKTCDGVHMQLSNECWKPIVQEFVGGFDHGNWEQPRLVLQQP